MGASGRVYTITIAAVNSPAAIFDAFELVPASTKPIQILRLIIGQIGEPTAEEENLMVTIMQGHATGGSGGSSPSPSQTNKSDTAAGFTAKTMNTTVATGGTPSTPFAKAVNFRSGDDIPFAPEEGMQVINERVVVRVSAPADAMLVVATLIVEEFG